MSCFSLQRAAVLLLVCLAAASLVLSCGPKAVKPSGEMDTPEHHVFTGMKQIDQEQYAAAQVSFERAMALAPRFARAYGGLALARAYSNDFKGAFDLLDKARGYARTNDEALFVHIGSIRVHTLSKAACARIGTDCEEDSSWLDKAKGDFDNAVVLDPRSAEAYYYMGLAYKNALRLPAAGQMFAKVLELRDL
jgi:Tfp pilus assembly protein PilF